MKRYKKHLIVILALVLCLSMLLAACIKETPPPTKKEGPDILPDLKDLSLAIADYAPAAKTYPAALKQEKANKLKAKQDEEKEKHNYAYENGEWTTNFDYDKGEYKWEEDTATFTKIFLFADVNELIDRMGIAALSEEKMSALVDYITRTDPASDAYIMTPGTGSAIRDYEELDELYDRYDDDDSDENYKALQKKRRKVMHEVVNIFGDDAAAAARTAVEVLAYSQKVVATKMIPDLEEKKGLSPSFDEFFKEELFDYDTLVYFRAFNETCGATSTGKYLLSSVNADYLIPADNKKEIVKLYGYYYQYEKKDFEVFDDAKYDRYLELSLKDYYDTEAEALEYRDYDRDRYVKAYRYSAEFYKKFYEAHFKFQFKQENHDLKVYGIENKKGEWNNKSYALEMQTGCDIGMAATLKLSDVNWIYTGKNANVINYNAAAKEYYSLPQSTRDNELNEANIALVHLRIEQLKSQLFTLRKSDMVNGTDFSNALIYQIYSFSGDYVRTMIANRKNDVYMRAEIERLRKKRDEAPQQEIQEIQEIDEKIDEKQKEIDRNDAMYENHKYFYVQNGKIEEQLRTAKNHDWNNIAEGIETTIAYDYDNYHNLYVRNAGIVVIDGVTYNDQVHIRFEDTLIKKKIVQQGDSTRDAKKEYDTDWAISRLLDNHENVFRYAYGQIKVEYLRYNDNELKNIILKDNVSEVKPDPKLEDPNSTALENPLIYAVSMSKREEFDALPSTVVVDTDENYKTDEGIELAIYEDNQWKGILPSNGNVDGCPGIYFINEKQEGNNKYTYHLIFEGWYLDKDLKVPAKLVNGRFGEEFDYDIRLYPSYIVIKYRKQG